MESPVTSAVTNMKSSMAAAGKEAVVLELSSTRVMPYNAGALLTAAQTAGSGAESWCLNRTTASIAEHMIARSRS